MKKAPVFLFFSLLLLSFCSQSQPHNIIKSWAFVRTSIAGTVQTDDNGIPSRGTARDYLIYIETKGTPLPQWETAFLDGLPYTVSTIEITQTPVNLGQLKGQKKSVTISKGEGNQLWQLIITPQQATEREEQASNPASIVLSGRFKNKAFTYRIRNIRELAKRFQP
jgi:hypothetical protein